MHTPNKISFPKHPVGHRGDQTASIPTKIFGLITFMTSHAFSVFIFFPHTYTHNKVGLFFLFPFTNEKTLTSQNPAKTTGRPDQQKFHVVSFFSPFKIN